MLLLVLVFSFDDSVGFRFKVIESCFKTGLTSFDTNKQRVHAVPIVEEILVFLFVGEGRMTDKFLHQTVEAQEAPDSFLCFVNCLVAGNDSRRRFLGRKDKSRGLHSRRVVAAGEKHGCGVVRSVRTRRRNVALHNLYYRRLFNDFINSLS